MSLFRTAVAGVSLSLMAGGYFVSQYGHFFGDVRAYVAAIQASPVPMLANILLLATVVLAFVPERGEPEA